MDAIITAAAAVATFTVARRTRRSRAAVAADRALVARIIESLHRSAAAVERALDLLYERQTSDEQVTYSTRHDNERGFSQAHARVGTWLVTTVMAEGRAQGRPAGQLLRGRALEMGRDIALHYARTQLLTVAREKAEAEARAYRVPTPEQVMGADVVAAIRFESQVEESMEVEAEEDAIAESLADEPNTEADQCCECPFADRCHGGYYYTVEGVERLCN